MAENDPDEDLLQWMIRYQRETRNLTDDQFRKLLESNDYTEIRKLPDGTWVGLTPLLFSVGLCIGLDPIGWARRYDYDNIALARAEIRKLERGDEVPAGWIDRRPE